MLDLLIRGGTIVDGTGSPGNVGDVGVRDGRIAALGHVEESARSYIDANGLIVAPGFVDIHTHYDAQVFWDPTLSPSSFHGVTTVVGGNCGFSIAPLTPEVADYTLRMLARVEGMPLQSLEQGVPWDWRSFDEYLGRLDDGLAINAGFLVGHCALRCVGMGERAVGFEATPEELARIQQLLRESLAGGGLGFSSTRAVTHNDGDGQPVPSRHASREELLALAEVVREFPGTALELLPSVDLFGEAECELMTSISLAANRPLNWNVLIPRSTQPHVPETQLAASDYAAERGARVVGLTVAQPMKARVNFASGFAFDALPGWSEVIGLPPDARKKALSDPHVRRRLREKAASDEVPEGFKHFPNWEGMTVEEAFEPANKPLEGRTLGDIGRERGQDAFEVMLDLAVAEDLRTSFCPDLPGERDEQAWKMRADAWRDPRTVIGASDAGAHLDMLDTFAFSTQLLGQGVRERGLISWEEAVHQLSDVPARLYGIRERGRLQEGWRADIAIFDPERVATGPVYTRFDLPGGSPRLYADAEGIEHVLVNGVEIVRGQAFSGALPGTTLRSGRDTETVEVPGGGAATAS